MKVNDSEENYERMSASLGDAASGSVTTAVRDTTIDGLKSMKMIILEWSMAKSLFQTRYDGNRKKHSLICCWRSEIVTIYVGEDGSEELAIELA
ncbi:MAG: hypothetical protein ACLRPQ_04750 [Streptococcus sp.]